MKTTFTKNEILSNRGCYDREQVLELSFINKEIIHIHDIINSEIPIKDVLWFVRKACELTSEQYRSMAIGVASIVLPIYEAKYPENTAPREAIKAAQDYLNGDINIDTLRHKRDAACAAADATYAACAATCAAAYAATYAADNAAAYAANAAANAAACVDDVNYTKQLKDFLILFTTI